MAQGSIKKRQLDSGDMRYDIVVDLGPDPVTGQRRQRKRSFRTKREAQTSLAAWLAAIDKGTAVDRTRQTVADLMAFWLESHKPNINAKSYDDYARQIRLHNAPALGHIPVQKLTPAHVQSFYNERLAAGCGTRTIEMCHLRLKKALAHAMRLGLVSRNVADAVTPPRNRPREMRTWDAEQARRFLTVADQSSRGPIWIVALATGMRRGELLGLRWQDIDWDRRVLSVRQTVGALRGKPDIKPPKTRSSLRDIPVPATVMLALREHRRLQSEQRLKLGALWEDHDLVFAASNGHPIYPDNLKRDYDRLIRLAGVPRIRIHDQRHTHVTLAILAGANIAAVSKRVGHARTSITMDIYSHVLPQQHVEVADKVGALLFDDGGSPDSASQGVPSSRERRQTPPLTAFT